MFISLDWISDFVDISDLDPKLVADRLTMATAEVEGISTITRFVDGVVVGEIVSAEPFQTPEGKKRTLCKVDCGDVVRQTVCGAPNARVGLKAPFAPAGVTLGDKTIEAAEVYGYKSEGILCSAAELGMSEWHEILFECPSSTPTGAKFSDFVPKTDTLIEIDNKSLTHRPDLWGHYGFARELAAVFHRELKPLPRHDVDQYASLPAFPVAIESDECLCYSGIVFGINAGASQVPSPIKMQRRLHALGQRTYDLLVDLTNYVSLELGQPTHAFDADLVSNIRVAAMGKEEVAPRRHKAVVNVVAYGVVGRDRRGIAAIDLPVIDHHPVLPELKEFLTAGDLVKFAKVVPSEAQRNRDITYLQTLIRKTTPQPPTTQEEKK